MPNMKPNYRIISKEKGDQIPRSPWLTLAPLCRRKKSIWLIVLCMDLCNYDIRQLTLWVNY
jgi:hypothetical protein